MPNEMDEIVAGVATAEDLTGAHEALVSWVESSRVDTILAAADALPAAMKRRDDQAVVRELASRLGSAPGTAAFLDAVEREKGKPRHRELLA